MSNICENTIKVFTEDSNNKTYIQKFIKDNFHSDLEEIDSNFLEGYFDSRWTFPEELMNDLYNGLPNKEDIDITVLSVEWGTYYCAFHTCDSTGWDYE